MNIIQKLLGQSNIAATQPTRRVVDLVRWKGNGRFDVEVVGESHYQRNLTQICGKRKEHGENRIVDATIWLEDNNPYDDKAVRVTIGNLNVGHLNRMAAPVYRLRLIRDGHPLGVGMCKAKIKGGWKRGKDVGSYGVWLDLPRLTAR